MMNKKIEDLRAKLDAGRAELEMLRSREYGLFADTAACLPTLRMAMQAL